MKPREEGAKQTTAAEVLAPEVSVGGRNIKPWSLGQLIKLFPTIKMIAADLKRRGIEIEKIDANLEKEFADYLETILPFVPEIFSVTLGITKEEAEEIDLGDTAQIILLIIAQNAKRIKNSFGLGQIRAMMQNLKP